MGSLPSFEAVKVAARGVNINVITCSMKPSLITSAVLFVAAMLLAKRLKLEVTRHSHTRAAEPIRREYLPGYHESRDGKALGAKQHPSIWRAREPCSRLM